MENPLVSVVIVTWNRRDDVLETIKSVWDQTYLNYEIVVVDNGSTDGTVETLRDAQPSVKVVSLSENLGASGGRNPGIEAAQGDIIFLLDSDASLVADTLTRVVSKLQSQADLGIVACKVVNAHTRQLDRNAGLFLANIDKANSGSEFYSYSFSECGCAIRKEVFDKVGLFWEQLFFGREGEEFGLRVWDAGYKILFLPDAIVYHRLSLEKRIDGCHRLAADIRNSLYIYLVHYAWWMLVLFFPLKIGSSLVRSFRSGCLSQTSRTLINVMGEVPGLWQKRRPISNKTARNYIQLQRDHGSLSWNLVSWFKS
jgi:GT2 family glycosyltransferase